MFELDFELGFYNSQYQSKNKEKLNEVNFE